MTLNKMNLDRIRDDDKFAVLGFVRQTQQLLDSTNTFYIIPELVIFTILSYYHALDMFDKDLCGKHLQVSDDGMTIDNNHITTSVWNQYSTVYGKLVIDSMKNGIYIWEFKNLEERTIAVNFGIDNADTNCLESGTFCNKVKASYTYHAGGGEIYFWDMYSASFDYYKLLQNKKKPKFDKIGSILMMKLEFVEDIKEGTLSFKIDDGTEFVVSDNVLREQGLKYRMAVSADPYGDRKLKIQLL